MKKLLIALLLALSLAGHSENTEADVLNDSAIAAYSRGEYEHALSLFLELLEQGYTSAPLLYNIGCSYFKTNDIAHAVLFYERALQLLPRDEDIRLSLNIANTRIADRIEPLPELFLKRWYLLLRNLLPADSWAVIVIIVFALFFVLAWTFLVSSGALRRTALITALLSLMLTLISFSLALNSYKETRKHPWAIIMAPVVTGKSSPAETGTDLFVIHEGLKVRLLEELSGWHRVRLPDGNTGWIPSKTLEPI